MTGGGGGPALRERVVRLLRDHHQATIATVGPADSDGVGAPHAATVFYAVDDEARLVFLSKGSSRHGEHIGSGGRVAATVAGEFDDWREIQGVQLWGTAQMLRGVARATALALYLRTFPFVAGLLKDPKLARQLAEIKVFRFVPEQAALTDNRTGFFGREILDLRGPDGELRSAVASESGLGPEAGAGESSATGVASPVDSRVDRLRGVVVSGRREAAGFVDVDWVRSRIALLMGAEPFPGTLNVELQDASARAAWRRLAQGGACFDIGPEEEGFCAASYYPVTVNGRIDGGIILPHVPEYPEDVVEVVAAEYLRDSLALADGDEVVLEWD